MPRRISMLLCFLIAAFAGEPDALAQTTYHLHKELSSLSSAWQLKTNGPDAAASSVQSADLKNVNPTTLVVQKFETQTGVPGTTGTIAAGSQVTFLIWERKTANWGTLYPQASLTNAATSAALCTATGSTALTTTLTKFSIVCTVPSTVTLSSTDRFAVTVGANMTAGPANHSVKVEADVEGVLNGNYDSSVTLPDPVPILTITSVTPSSGPVNLSVTITGTGFGGTQGTSTVKFNGLLATPTSWANTSISVPVPSGATSGPVVVTVGGIPAGCPNSNCTFSVLPPPTITSLSPASARVDDTVTVLGNNFMASQGASSVKFNGMVASVKSWSNTAISTTVPTGATSGNVVVTVSNQASNRLPFTVISTNPVLFTYDDLGRLIQVTDPSGNSAIYHYDAVGNITSIDRPGLGAVTISSLSPGSGPVGQSVTISGTGFSATPIQNTVTFNGTQASIVASTVTQITALVPSGATTGSVRVTAPNGAATSAMPFLVTTGNGAPTITGFAPTVGTPGTPVTVTGTNFETTTANDLVAFNGAVSWVTAATASVLSTTVPQASGGHVLVATPRGTAVSAADFFIPPAPYTAADVLVNGRMAMGVSSTVSITTALKIGLMLFDGTAGQRISLQFTNDTIGGAEMVSILRPDGSTLISQMAVYGLIVQTLPATGTYTIVVDPSGSTIGSVTLTLFNVPADVVGTIVPGGPPVTVTTTTPGQNAKLTFRGTAGQRISLQLTSDTIGGAEMVSMLRPDGSTLISQMAVYGLIVQTLPTTGTYAVVVDPSDSTIGSATLTLFNVPPDVVGTIVPGGPPVTVTTTTPGQNAKLTFSGTAGQRISLQFTNDTIGGAEMVSILRPDGSTLISQMAIYGSINAQILPTTGTYTIVVDPSGSATGSLTLTLALQ